MPFVKILYKNDKNIKSIINAFKIVASKELGVEENDFIFEVRKIGKFDKIEGDVTIQIIAHKTKYRESYLDNIPTVIENKLNELKNLSFVRIYLVLGLIGFK